MNRNTIVGCKLDKEMKKAFENECRKEHRTVSSTLLLFIEDYLNKKGKDRKAEWILFFLPIRFNHVYQKKVNIYVSTEKLPVL